MGTCPPPKLPRTFSVENLGGKMKKKNHPQSRYPEIITVSILVRLLFSGFIHSISIKKKHTVDTVGMLLFPLNIHQWWTSPGPWGVTAWFLTWVDGNYHLQFSDLLSDWSWRHAAVQRILGNVMDLWHSLKGETSGWSHCTLQVSHNCATRCAGESQWHL